VVVAPSSVTADGVAAASITVKAVDDKGRALAGRAVAFAVSGTDNQLGAATASTDHDGGAATTVSSTRAETKQVTVTVDGVALPSVPVTFGAGPASALTFVVSPTAVEAGATMPSVRVALLDAHGNPVPTSTAPVNVALIGGTAGASLAGTTSISAAAGEAAFADLSIDRAGQGYQLVASSAGLADGTSASFDVSPAAASLVESTVEATPAEAVADGTAISVRVAVRDAFGNAVPGADVTLDATGSDNVLTQPSAPTDADGVATGAITSTRAEAKTITASVGGLPLAQPATATFLAGPPASLVLLAAPVDGIVGGALADVRVGLLDAGGNATAGAVTLSLAAGPAGASLLGTLTAEASGSVATFSDLSVRTAGAGYVLRATAGAAHVDTPAFAVRPGDVTSITVTSSRSPVADGVDTSTITVTIRDSYGNAIPGLEVTLAASGDANTLAAPTGTAGADGSYATTLASTRAETKHVTATVSGHTTPGVPVTFVPGPADPAQSDFSAAPGTAPADGTTAVTLSALVRDAFGNPVPGVTVAFASSRPADAPVQPAAVTDAAGVATGSMTSATAGTAVVSATVDGNAFAATRSVRFESAFAATAPVKALAVAGRTCASGTVVNSSRRLAVDALGIVYLASLCGGEGFVAASADGGKTFGAPVTTGMVGLAQIAVRGGPDGVAYVGGTTSAGATLFSRTVDQGATFSAPVQLGTVGSSNAPSIAARGDEVFVQPLGGHVVYRSSSRGEGAFTTITLPSNSPVFVGLMIDSAGIVWSGYDNPSLYLSESTDGGATFSPWAAIMSGTSVAAISYSAWDLGGDVIWVAGYQQVAYRASVAAPTAGASVSGLVAPSIYYETAIAVDAAGAAYVARGDGTNGVRLQRALLTDAAFGDAAVVDAAGRNPALAAPSGSGKVIVAYEKAGEVWVTVRTF
jgi:hypothetical protein